MLVRTGLMPLRQELTDVLAELCIAIEDRWINSRISAANPGASRSAKL
jgi:hypothetical protein